MIELIPSKDARELAEKIGWEFSDLDKAAIVYNQELPIEQGLAALEELKGELADEVVIAQIDVHIAKERDLLEKFAQPNGAIYVLKAQLEDEDDEYLRGNFTDLASARAVGMKFGAEFIIEKHQLLGEGLPLPKPGAGMFNPNMLPDLPDDKLIVRYKGVSDLDEDFDPDELAWDAQLGRAHYSAEGEMMWYYCKEGPEPETREDVEREFDLKSFRNAYVEMPNPFEAGDIVRGIGPAARCGVGVVETSQEQWGEWKERRHAGKAEWADFSDEQITVSFFDEKGGFSHNHIQPIFLERYEIPEDAPEWRLVMYAGDLLKGIGGIDWFVLYLDEYRERKQAEEAFAKFKKGETGPKDQEDEKAQED